MTRTPTLPLDDVCMWRKAIARAHPDAGGDHELCVWMQAVKEAVCDQPEAAPKPRPEGRSHRPASDDDPDRVPFPPSMNFEECTRTVLRMRALGTPYGRLLSLLADCSPAQEGSLFDQQRRGASYRLLAAIGHRVGMTKQERVRWYRIAEDVPLSQRHAGHILSRLKRMTA